MLHVIQSGNGIDNGLRASVLVHVVVEFDQHNLALMVPLSSSASIIVEVRLAQLVSLRGLVERLCAVVSHVTLIGANLDAQLKRSVLASIILSVSLAKFGLSDSSFKFHIRLFLVLASCAR